MEEQIELLPDLAGCGFYNGDEKLITFAECIAAIRSQREYTISEVAQITRNPQRTVEYWLSGAGSPARNIREKVIADLSNPENPPSARTRRRVENSHHLIWDRAKGWEMRVRVVVLPKPKPGQPQKKWNESKEVSRTIKKRLRTRNLDEAIKARDLLVSTFKDLGLTVVDRRQKRQKGLPGKR